MNQTQIYPNEYIHFLYDFIVNLAYTKVIKSINAYQQTQPNEFVTKFIQQSTSRELWNPIFEELYYPIKYYLEISNIPDVTESYDPQYGEHTYLPIYILYPTFQTYVDHMVNLNNTCGWDYRKFIENMNDETFRNNLKLKWKIENKKNVLYNKIINNVANHIFLSCNRFDLIKNKSYYDNQTLLFLNIIPFYEYVNIRNTSKKDRDLEKPEHENLKETEFNNLETRTLNMIYEYVS